MKDLDAFDAEELNELKVWLFKENVRIETEKNELQKLRHSMEIDKKRLEQENRFFDQKMMILQGGFAQLEEDRRKFQRERDKFSARKEAYTETQTYFGRIEIAEMLFRGVNSLLALKKRYKDLIKMFHPDNVAGDHEMIQIINKEYEELKKTYDIGKQA